MPVNQLEKDTHSSDPSTRAWGIRTITDLCSHISDIAPFLIDICKTGCCDWNPFVQQVSIFALIKIFDNHPEMLADYIQQLNSQIFLKNLENRDTNSLVGKKLFETMLITFLKLNLKVREEASETFSKLFYSIILNLCDISHAYIFN